MVCSCLSQGLEKNYACISNTSYDSLFLKSKTSAYGSCQMLASVFPGTANI